MYCVDIITEGNCVEVIVTIKDMPRSKKIPWWKQGALAANTVIWCIGNCKMCKEDDKWRAMWLSVKEAYRHKGIATLMYNALETQGYKLKPSKLQTEAGRLFWESRK